MSAKNGFETKLLQLLLQNTDIANIGDAGGILGSVDPGSWYIAIYTVVPGEGTDGTECAYTDYDRVAVSRNGSAGFTVSGSNGSNTASVTFPANGGAGTEVGKAFALCRGGTPTTSDQELYGLLTADITIAPTDVPQFTIGDLDINCD